jgi:hypothetical protein
MFCILYQHWNIVWEECEPRLTTTIVCLEVKGKVVLVGPCA